jgi:hypothetical protein
MEEPRMLGQIRSTFREIKAGQPGRRFFDYYERNQRKGGGRAAFWRPFAQVGIGFILLLCGLLLSLTPGAPGFLLWIPGIALIAARSRLLAHLLDRLESGARRVWPR